MNTQIKRNKTDSKYSTKLCTYEIPSKHNAWDCSFYYRKL